MRRLFLPGLLVVLGATWGLTQPLSKIAVSTGHQPFGLIFWQLAICAVFLGAICLWQGRLPALHGPALRFYVIIALIGTLIPSFTFFAAVAHLPAGIMAIIISTIPMLAFAIALPLGMDQPAPRRMLGLGLGALGVALIAQPGGSLGAEALPWLAVAMIGPLFYAAEATYVARVGTVGLDPVQAMCGASIAGVVLCLPLAVASGQFIDPRDSGIGRPEAALFLSSVLHACAYTLYVWLAGRAGSVFAAQSSYLVTAMGVFWAMVLLGERFAPILWFALVLMLAGVALVQPREKTR